MKLSFYGGVRDVTGSCYLLEGKKFKVLVDCGMFQGGKFCDPKNFEDFPFTPSEIDAVLLTHAHYDHCGRIPWLIKKGFKGSIFTTPPTKSLATIVLRDAVNVMHYNEEKCAEAVLYGMDEVDHFQAQTKGVNYHTQFEPAPGLKVMFHDAGHILGSAIISIRIDGTEFQDGEGRRFVFSGDLGNDDVPILPDTEILESADIMICESTYGDKDHDPVEGRSKDLKEMIQLVIGRGGTLIIPAFSIERTQELLYEIDGLVDKKEIPEIPIYLDSPLAIRATEIYQHFKEYLRFDREILSSPDKDFFSFDRLYQTLTVDASKKINHDRGPKIIIAGSGMMTGGRVLHHLKQYLPDERSGVLIIGYQAEGTLGRRIQEGAEKVEIFKEEVPVHATIKSLDSFSAHADRKKVSQWLNPKAGPAKQILLTHGDPETKISFQKYLKGKVGGAEVEIPEFGEVMEY